MGNGHMGTGICTHMQPGHSSISKQGATDGLADTALTAIGTPELVPAADALIDRGAKALQRRGTEYLSQQIDASGRGVRYMAPSTPP